MREYVRRRNGVPLGAAGSMTNMMKRSFGAGSLAHFWRHWNPIFGYGLGRFVYAPLRKVLPVWFALILTFVTCGVLHDAVSMAAGAHVAFLFTPWFFLLGCGVVVGEWVGFEFSQRPFWFKVGVNVGYISLCLAGALWICNIVGKW